MHFCFPSVTAYSKFLLFNALELEREKEKEKKQRRFQQRLSNY